MAQNRWQISWLDVFDDQTSVAWARMSAIHPATPHRHEQARIGILPGAFRAFAQNMDAGRYFYGLSTMG